ncbi:MAG: quinoprotein dehydrogenase-associated SoxYZ-like carrier, partial [Methylophilaceae bacterium]
GAQVPIEIRVDQSQTGGNPIKNLYLLVDANPIPLASTYHLTDKLGNFKLSTRIRMEMDSYIRAVGETADGKLVMGSVEVRAAGGCGGMIDADEKEIRASAGKIKMNVEAPAKAGEAGTVTFIIKHPMRTGLQRDLVSQGFIPAFYINKANFSFNNEPVLSVDVNVGTSEDPYMRFEFLPSGSGIVKVEATDNEGKAFEHQADIKI